MYIVQNIIKLMIKKDIYVKSFIEIIIYYQIKIDNMDIILLVNFIVNILNYIILLTDKNCMALII